MGLSVNLELPQFAEEGLALRQESPTEQKKMLSSFRLLTFLAVWVFDGVYVVQER